MWGHLTPFPPPLPRHFDKQIVIASPSQGERIFFSPPHCQTFLFFFIKKALFPDFLLTHYFSFVVKKASGHQLSSLFPVRFGQKTKPASDRLLFSPSIPPSTSKEETVFSFSSKKIRKRICLNSHLPPPSMCDGASFPDACPFVFFRGLLFFWCIRNSALLFRRKLFQLDLFFLSP